MTLSRTASALPGFLLATGLFVSSARAYDAHTIRDWRTPIAYQLELEPHILAGTDPPGPGAGSGVGFGARGSFVILPEGFIRNVNDSVAIGVGLDIGRYYGSWTRDECLHYESGPAGTNVCTQVTSNGGTYTYVYIPVVMQWNFWLTQHFSAFAEPGLNVFFVGNHGVGVSPAGYIGGRYYIANGFALTGRIGYPDVSLGLSIMM